MREHKSPACPTRQYAIVGHEVRHLRVTEIENTAL